MFLPPSTNVHLSMTAAIPAEVKALALRLGATPIMSGSTVSLTQAGTMRAKPGAKLMAFTARQTIETSRSAFDWHASARPLGGVKVRDAFDGMTGQLAVKLFGLIPLASIASSPALAKGELLRYLAELAWAPDAILHNPELYWHVLDSNSIRVTARAGEVAAAFHYKLDRDGRPVSGFATDRPYADGDRFQERPWHCRYSDYRRSADRWLPFAGQVGWDDEQDENVYWRGRLTSWTFM